MLAVQWSHSQRPTPQAPRRAPWLPARVVTELTRAEGTSRGRDVKCVCEFSRGSAAARPRPPRAAHRPAAARLEAGVAGVGETRAGGLSAQERTIRRGEILLRRILYRRCCA